MFNVLLANAIVPPLMTIFDIFYMIKLFKRREISKQSVDSIYTQAEANTLDFIFYKKIKKKKFRVFEGMNLEMWRKYPILIKTMLVTAFYAPLIPLLIPISLFALIIYYWVEKYLIINRYKRPPIISASLNRVMTDMLELVPLFMAVLH